MKTYGFQDKLINAEVRKAGPKTYTLRLRFSGEKEQYLVELTLTQPELDNIRYVTNLISEKEDW